MHGTTAEATQSSLHAVAKTRQAQADYPVTFAGTVGLYSSPNDNSTSSDTAVLFVSSWGFEELCARKFWRLLAEDLGQNGMASLRFDFPGTGDALDLENYSAGLDVWTDAIMHAGEVLRDLSGATRLLLVGHGIGAALAWHAAEKLENIAGIAMAAPAPSGRRWIREFMTLSRIADHGAIKPGPTANGPAMGEQRIPEAILEDIRNLDISKSPKAVVPDMLVLTQDARASDAAFVEHLGSLGVQVQSRPFEGYNLFIRDVLLSVPPYAAIAELTAWAAALKGKAQGLPRSDLPETQRLSGNGFTETPVRFAPGNRLYGILCEPHETQRGALVVMLSTGYDRMSGWGRITTRICRDLARAGIPAFRFDFANVADSPPQQGLPDQVMYSESLERDVGEALAFLKKRQGSPVILSGRCSGAYTAFKSAARYDSVKAVLPVNPYDFTLAPDTDIDALLRASLQPLSSYGAKMKGLGFWKRVLRGEVDLARGIRNMTKMSIAKVIATILPILVRIPARFLKANAASADFELLAEKGTQLTLIYSEGDLGVSNLETRFGKRGYLMGRFGNANLIFVADADHNLTTEPARERWLNELKKTALQLGS